MRSAFLLLVLTFPSSGHAESLKLITENYPPYNFQEGEEISGLNTEILQATMKKAGIATSFSLLPWARALVLAEREASTCVYSAIRTPERENAYQWISPLIVDRIALFALANRNLHLHNIEEARNYRVGSYPGSMANNFLRAHQIEPDEAPSDDANLAKLELGRIDFWVASTRDEKYLARISGRANKLAKAFIFPKVFKTKMYLACNKGISNYTVARLNAVLAELKANGTIAKILRKYE
jgi:polar amino acid transport system substrate-binding protein